MRLHNNLYASLGDIRKELPHDRLPGRVEMDFRVFNQKNVPGAGGNPGNNNGKNLSDPKTYINGAVKFRGGRSFQPKAVTTFALSTGVRSISKPGKKPRIRAMN